MDIRAIIKKKGFTQQDIADKLGLSKSSLSQMLDRPIPSRFQALADVLGCNIADFFLDEVKPKKNIHLIVNDKYMNFTSTDALRDYVNECYPKD